MSQENVEAFKRGLEAYNRRDLKVLLEVHDPEVEWHPMLQVLFGGEATVYWGHDGVREFVRDTDEAFAESRIEISEIRDLGDRLFAKSRFLARGKASGAETEAPLAFVVDFRSGRVVRARTFLDPDEAAEAAGLRE